MLKRLAAATAVTLGTFQAIALVGAPPALAVGAPSVSSPECGITSGTLYVLENAADIAVSTDGTDLIVADGTGPCSDPSESFAFADLDAAVFEADGGSITFDLEDVDSADRVADYDRIDYSVAADTFVALQAGGIHDSRADVTVQVDDNSFDTGNLVADLYTTRFVFDGGDGDDTLDATRVYDFPVISDGGDGNDTLRGGDDDDLLTGGYGDDHVAGNDGNDDVAGDEGSDEVRGGDGNDDLEYADGSGSDTLYPGDGDDDVWSDHSDTVSYADSSRSIDVDFREGLEVRSSAGDDDLDEMPHTLIGSPYADDIHGDADANRLDGGSGDDTILGGGGNDVLVGDAGDDLLRGESGVDYVFGESGADTLYGGPANDALQGGDGNDTMFGRAGNDTLRGGAGTDRANGGDGRDACTAETRTACELG